MGCGAGGDAVYLIMKIKNCKFKTAIRRLQEWGLIRRGEWPPRPAPTATVGASAHRSGPSPVPSPGPQGVSNLPVVPARKPWPKSLAPELVEPLTVSYFRHLWGGSSNSKLVLAYLRWRGLRDDTIKRAGLGFFESTRRPDYWPLRSTFGLTIPWMENQRVQFMMFRARELAVLGGPGPGGSPAATTRSIGIIRPSSRGSTPSGRACLSSSSRASWTRYCWGRSWRDSRA